MNWFNKNPKVEVKPSETDQLLYRAGWMVVVVNVFLVLGAYADLPETIPTHFNFLGRVDGYGHKSALWAIPMLSAGLYLALGLVATKLKPWFMNYPVKVTEENATKLYALAMRMLAVMNFCFVVAFLMTTGIILLRIKGWIDAMDVQLFIGLWILNGLIPLYFVYKMVVVVRE